MKYFIDTEFLEGTQNKTFCGIKVGNTKPTIDLISIGIVSEDGREYYAISKDFNLKEAWNRYQLELEISEDSKQRRFKNYWIRENVLKPIWEELRVKLECTFNTPFAYKVLKRLIELYGKTNKQIAEEVKEFVYNQTDEDKYNGTYKFKPEFYGYYADYDWVVFCWLFGKMMDLPTAFPMYCRDLNQELYEKAFRMTYNTIKTDTQKEKDIEEWIEYIKALPNYPKQTNEHNALADARWNKELYNFLKTL